MQVEHKTEKGTLLFLKIENDYSVAGLNDGHIYFWTSSLSQSMGDYPLCVDIPNGDFEYIGLTSEVTEETSKVMVDDKSKDIKKMYKSYMFDEYLSHSAKGSFKSLVQHLQINESEKWIVLFKEN
jgi:hypothetical protein